MLIEKKLSILRSIADELNKEKILWGLGGSALLYLHGRVANFHDLDLFIGEEDVDRAKDIFYSLGKLLPKKESSVYASRHFYTFDLNGLLVDMIEGFTLYSEKEKYFFPLYADHIHGYYDLQGVDIPLMKLSLWKHYYTLMKREDKAELC